MVRRKAVLISLTLISIVSFVHGFLEIIPERAGIEYIDKKHVLSAYVNVRKTGRGGKYVANLDFTITSTVGNNLTLHLLCYEFLHNEYRRSFIEMHLKICNMVENDPFIGVALRNAGVSCPVPPGEYHLHNLTLEVPEVQNLKWVFPFEKTKFRGVFHIPATNETIAIGYMMLLIRQSRKKLRT